MRKRTARECAIQCRLCPWSTPTFSRAKSGKIRNGWLAFARHMDYAHDDTRLLDSELRLIAHSSPEGA
jgi:hypothetical protein